MVEQSLYRATEDVGREYFTAQSTFSGLEVIVDGAHSFGLLDFAIPDLECDYFGTSLHKFLSAPIGSGMLWIKKEKISKVWPLVCNDKPQSPDIRKFETLGFQIPDIVTGKQIVRAHV